MKKYIYLLFVFIVGFSIKDVQKEIITLNWEETTSEMKNGVKIFFENTDFPNLSSELPVYSRLYDLDDLNKTLRFSVENPVYEDTALFIENLEGLEINDELTFLTHVLKSGNTQKIEFQLFPLKKEDGKVYRLKSFELKQFSDEMQSKSASVAEQDWKTESVLNSGTWVKISTPDKGIYKIPYSKLSDWGFSSPSEVGVFGSGGTILSENPGEITYDDLEQCAVWTGTNNGEECLFFYAPGVVEWELKSDGTFEHDLNDYAQIGYFFLGETGTQKYAETFDEISDEITDFVSTYDEYSLIEDELVNLLEGSGKQWFGDSFYDESTHNYSFEINDIDESAMATLEINAAARSYQISGMYISSGTTSIGSLTFSKVSTSDSYATYASEKNNSFEIDVDDETLSLTLSYAALNSSAEAWLDYLLLTYRRNLIAGDDPVFFRDSESVGDGNIAEFSIENASSYTRVFDVSDVNNLTEVTGDLSDEVLKIRRPAEDITEYVVVNTNGNFDEPEFVKEVENQNLHALSAPEFLIVSHSDFMTSAEELAEFHREYDDMSVEVVNAQKIYNEFSSGTKSATGIRNFIKMLYDQGSTLKYVLLMGTGSYDNKGINDDSDNFIPTYQSENSLTPTSSFVTDDYFVMLDAGETVYSGAIDLGIGRIPASSSYEAQIVVDKIENYYEPDALGDWRNVLCFIADDEDSGLHAEQAEQLTDLVNENYNEFITKKIYLDAYEEETNTSGSSYPDVNDAIAETVEDGVLIINYTGHANEFYLAEENILDVSEINSWTNIDKLPILVTATCEFSRFDADDTSAGEYILLNANGGGIGLFSTTRVVYASANFELSKSFYSYIFEQDEDGDYYRMGDVMRLAKTSISSGTNKRNFTLLADPALTLSFPKYEVVTSTVNGLQAGSESDTLGALQKVTVTGYIADYSGNKQSDFEGEIIPIVYDKEEEMETLGNDGQDQVTYTVQENVIYKGLASVIDGEFSYSFVVPKDISYSAGTGKIVYYADNDEIDANGAFENFHIGGSSSTVTDNTGPEIQLFMDTEDFESGDETSASPTLIAYLSDENGINTVGTGIGHDITAVIDNDYTQVYVLNNYYQAEKDDYTSGSLEYSLSDLEEGFHTLTLKAWDVANNSSEAEIEFKVTSDFYITEISNYPNPASTYTYFVLTHNQPGSSLDIIFDIYASNGQRVDQFQTEVSSNGNTTNPIYWDLSEAASSITSGVYVYRAIAKYSDGAIVSKSGKMIIVH